MADQISIRNKVAAHYFDFSQHDVTVGRKASAVVPPMSWSHDRMQSVVTHGIDERAPPCAHIEYKSRRDVSDTYSKNPEPESDELVVDFVNEFHVTRDADGLNDSDTSLSTQTPSPSSSEVSQSISESTTASTSHTGTKKKARTNYSPEQIQTLDKTFHENPYPDPDMMEQMSKDLEIPESKLKVWFQNKRARWRRRSQKNLKTYHQYGVMSMPPVMMSPLGPYNPFASLASSPILASPSHHQPGHFFPYQTMPSSIPMYRNCLQQQHNQEHQPKEQQQQQQESQTRRPALQEIQCHQQQLGYKPDTTEQQRQQRSPEQQEQKQTTHFQQQPRHMFSPAAPSVISPYQTLTHFSPYAYPLAYGHYPFYC